MLETHIKTLLADAVSRLNNDEATLEAQLLLQNVLHVNRAWLIAHADDQLNSVDEANFKALVTRRAAGEPIAYILGQREFYGLTLKVTPDTLIPRPDTETLVDAALTKIPLQSNALQNNALQNNASPSFPRKRESILPPSLNANLHENDEQNGANSTTQDTLAKIEVHLALSICDLGTGTGAIALAIAKNRPQAHVTAVDFAEAALSVAQENAQRLGIHNITFVKSDWLNALTNQRFNVIVSNPPYIESADAHLSQGDLRFEPHSALASGEDGLDDIRHIIAQAPAHLAPNGWLMLEHGYNQAPHVARLLQQAGFVEVTHALDLSGIQRVTLGCLKRHIV